MILYPTNPEKLSSAAIPESCSDFRGNRLAQRIYAAYHRGMPLSDLEINGGNVEIAHFSDLPKEEQDKWQSAADFVVNLSLLRER